MYVNYSTDLRLLLRPIDRIRSIKNFKIRILNFVLSKICCSGNSLQCVERSLVPKAKISSTSHVQLLQSLYGKQQQHISLL